MTTAEYGWNSTATDVLAGIDLHGRTALVTGGYSGIGLATTVALAAAGALVVVPARRPQVARAAVDGVAGVSVEELDLADLSSVESCARRLLQAHPAIDIVINNAGVMACPETRVGPGWEAQLATNHLGHFALVNRIWPAIAAAGSARVIAVASGYDPADRMRWDDLQFEQGYDKWAAYGQAKLANVLFAAHLNRLGAAAGVRAFSANPGYILTPLQRHLQRQEMVDAGWIDDAGTPVPELFKSTEQGAATQVWAATAPGLASHGGDYCRDCAIVTDLPIDATEADRLWTVSAELTGVDAFG